ncbi:PIN domain-containing protein [Microbacterium resistens]
MRHVFLVDNSVLQRVHRSPAVADALIELLSYGDLGGCLPQRLEEGYSARSAREHDAIMAASDRARIFLTPDERVAEIAIDLQRRLFHAGIGRAAGVSDLQIAATAIRHSADRQRVVVVHYDADFDSIAQVAPELEHRWIVPRGSVD